MSNGMFAFLRHRDSNAISPEVAKKLVTEAGLPEDMVPEYSGDRRIVGWVLDKVCREAQANNAAVRDVIRQLTKRKRGETSFAIVREEVDSTTNKLNTTQIGTIDWSSEKGFVATEHPLSQKVRELYNQYQGKLMPNDWTKQVAALLSNGIAATQMRNDGRVYWIPPQTVDQAVKMQAVLKEVGIDFVLSAVEGEVAQAAVIDAVSGYMSSAIVFLSQEVTSFDATIQERTVVDRTEKALALNKRLALYGEAIGFFDEGLGGLLKEATGKLGNLAILVGNEKSKKEAAKAKKAAEAKAAKEAAEKAALPPVPGTPTVPTPSVPGPAAQPAEATPVIVTPTPPAVVAPPVPIADPPREPSAVSPAPAAPAPAAPAVPTPTPTPAPTPTPTPIVPQVVVKPPLPEVAPPPPPPAMPKEPAATCVGQALDFVSQDGNITSFRSTHPAVIQAFEANQPALGSWVVVKSYGHVYLAVSGGVAMIYINTTMKDAMVKALSGTLVELGNL